MANTKSFNSVQESRSVRVTFLEKENVTKDILENEFSQYGTVARVDVNQAEGFAIVHFFHPFSAKRAEQGSKSGTKKDSLTKKKKKGHVSITGRELVNHDNIDWIVKHPKSFVSTSSPLIQPSRGVHIPMMHPSEFLKPDRVKEQILQYHQETNSTVGILDKEGRPCCAYASAPVLVIWDTENVRVNPKWRGENIKEKIIEFLHSQGHLGDSITIHLIAAQEDIVHEDVRKTLQPSGIKFTNVNSNRVEAIIQEIIWWTQAHPAPATVFLISGDKDFSFTVASLEQAKYNTIVAYESGRLSDMMKCVGYKFFDFKMVSVNMKLEEAGK